LKGNLMKHRKGTLVLSCLILLSAFALAVLSNPSGLFAAPPAATDEIPEGRVVLIVNGDDVGMGPVYTDATLAAFFSGRITSLSLLAPAADADRAIGLLKAHPGIDVGVHLTLTGDWKPLTAGESLRGKNGRMWNTDALAARNVKPEEAAVEWEAQLAKVMNAGLAVSHLDSHMGSYFNTPALFQAAFALARKYGIPLIASYTPGPMPPEWKNLFGVSSYSGIYSLNGPAETPENRAAAYWAKFAGLTPGVHYLFTHQGQPVPKNELVGDMDLRINEGQFWNDPQTAKKLGEKGIVLIGCEPLKKQFQKALKTAGVK
jgi:chitin disaccharide deacetylase